MPSRGEVSWGSPQRWLESWDLMWPCEATCHESVACEVRDAICKARLMMYLCQIFGRVIWAKAWPCVSA